MSGSVVFLLQKPLSLEKRDREAALQTVQGVTSFLSLALKLRDYVTVLLLVAIVTMGMTIIAKTNANICYHYFLVDFFPPLISKPRKATLLFSYHSNIYLFVHFG